MMRKKGLGNSIRLNDLCYSLLLETLSIRESPFDFIRDASCPNVKWTHKEVEKVILNYHFPPTVLKRSQKKASENVKRETKTEKNVENRKAREIEEDEDEK